MFLIRRLCIPVTSHLSSPHTWLTNWKDAYGVNIKPRKKNTLPSYKKENRCLSSNVIAHYSSSRALNQLPDTKKYQTFSEHVYKSLYNCNQLSRTVEHEYDETHGPRIRKSTLAGLVIALGLLGLFKDKPHARDRQNDDDKRKTVLKPRQSFADKDDVATRKKIVLHKKPQESSEIPPHVPYLIIGGGTASCSAFQTILKKDPSAKVLVISSEPYYPYRKPPLSKEMWFQERPSNTKPHVFKLIDGQEKSLFYRSAESYKQCGELMTQDSGGVAVARGWQVKRIDVSAKRVVLEDGYSVGYDKCLIATGCSPKVLSFLKSESSYVSDRVSFFCDFSDFQKVDSILKSGKKKIVIIGGGILGSELACSLSFRGRKNKVDVTQIFSESGNLRKILPEHLSNWTTAKLKKEGIKIYANCSVKSVSAEDGLTLHLNNGENVSADHVILAVGGVPNTQFAESSNLEIDHESGGFVVNAELMARSNVWVAGDCCSFYDSKMGRTRLERYDHAVATGRLAAENMTGAGKPYDHQSVFWSDLGPKFGYEAVGLIDSRLTTLSVFCGTKNVLENVSFVHSNTGSSGEPDYENCSKGIVFYLKNEVIVGILLWNVYGQLSVARQIIADKKRESELNDVIKLFSLDDDKPFPHLDGAMYVL